MNNKIPQEIAFEKIRILSLFRDNIYRWFNGQYKLPNSSQLRLIENSYDTIDWLRYN